MKFTEQWTNEKMKLTKKDLIQELKEALQKAPATRHQSIGSGPYSGR